MGTNNRLTVLIPFVNEGDEVVATVKDVRHTAGNSVDILVLNDCSTDGRDYETELKPYSITYLYNKENHGSAPSRDICVQNCKTPYFLFLDAHMRFFCENWVERIISMLDADDRQLLCMQTVALQKDKKGVQKNPKHAPTFGAFMPLSINEYQPDIKWNRKELNPDSDTQEIPMVLGAAYAGSCRYWNYLHGMEGLMRYGTEEQFISLKAWLEGGRCVLLKDIVIGHIYRDKSPFKRYVDVEIFNKLWIVSLLFPTFLKSKSFAIAQKQDFQTFGKALRILKSKKEELLKQRHYYKGIFTRPFDAIIDMNRPLLLEHVKKSSEKNLDKVASVADFIKGHLSQHCGLFNGKMGQILWLEHYSRHADNTAWDDLASELWEQVCTAIEEKTLPWYFSTGLAGIGWALHYLYDRGFLEYLPTDILGQIDAALLQVSLGKLQDTSIDFGLAGILAYCCVRMRFAKECPFHEETLKELTRASEYIINTSADVRELSYAYYWQELQRGEENKELPLSLNDVMEFREAFADNSEYWENSLEGAALSATFMAMIINEKKQCHEQTEQI